MRISELARRAGVTTKAVRYYERLGLVTPSRLPNGYRDYDDGHLRAVIEIRELASTGLSARQTTPFVECLALGHEHGDDCVSSLAAYRNSIDELDRMIHTLQRKRNQLAERLDESANRTFTKESPVSDFHTLPEGLPIPADDGAAAHLSGAAVPKIALTASDGRSTGLRELGPGRTVIYVYPLTGRPGVDLPAGWDAIPGARGCTTEACDFRDHFDELRDAGVSAVYGFSSQEPDYQAEVVSRLRLPFTMLSDPTFALARSLSLPTFTAPGEGRLYSRLTLVIRDGIIEHVFYPIFPPSTHAQQVLAWLRENPAE